MFSFLREIDGRLYVRYLTLEKNIRAASNSFYDAYLDLVEQLLRTALDQSGIDVSAGCSCGSLLRNPECRRIFVELSGVSEWAWEKLADYTRKANAHKHGVEKRITLETVEKYVAVLREAATGYAEHRGIAVGDTRVGYYADIFGSYERENAALRARCEELLDRLDSTSVSDSERSEAEELRALMSSERLGSLPIDEQNLELKRQLERLDGLAHSLDEIKEGQRREEQMRRQDRDEILGAIGRLNDRIDAGERRAAQAAMPTPEQKRLLFRRFVSKAEKKYIWLGDAADFAVTRRTAALLLLASALLMIGSSVLTTVTVGFYTTYTFFENLWLLLTLYMLKYVLVAKRHYSATRLSQNTHQRYRNDENGVPRERGVKMKYKVILVLGILGALLDLFLIWSGEGQNALAHRVLATVLELSVIFMMIFSFVRTHSFFYMYFAVSLKGLNAHETDEVTLVLDTLTGELSDEAHFYEAYPTLKP